MYPQSPLPPQSPLVHTLSHTTEVGTWPGEATQGTSSLIGSVLQVITNTAASWIAGTERDEDQWRVHPLVPAAVVVAGAAWWISRCGARRSALTAQREPARHVERDPQLQTLGEALFNLSSTLGRPDARR